MNIDNVEVDNCNLAEAFIEYFDKNVTTIVNSFKVGQDIYNGNKKLTCINQNFINQTNLMKALDSIKIKNTEGNDRIPKRIVNEGKNVIINSLNCFI